jgi:hypothetical protein
MKKLAFFAAVALLAAGCSSGDDSSSDTASTAAFIGNWLCTKNATLKYTSPALPDATSSISANITFSAPAYGVLLAIIQNGDAGSACRLNFHTASSTQASVDSNQPGCVDSSGVSVNFASGSAASGGANKLTVTLDNFTFTGQSPDDAGVMQTARGTGTFIYDCTR